MSDVMTVKNQALNECQELQLLSEPVCNHPGVDVAKLDI